MISSQHLSHTAKRSLAKGLLAAGATMAFYVLIVVLTTPNLPLSAAISAAFLANSIVIGGTALGSFFSFFSLVPLGCCGSWLLVLSLLPSVFGTALSVYLIDYSRPLSYIAVATVFGFAAISGVRLHRSLNEK